MFLRILFCVGIVLGSSKALSNPDLLRLVIPEFKPFTHSINSDPGGIGVDLVSKYLEELNWPYSVQVVPNYGRALAEVKRGKADGFFLASENSERNQYAKLSKAILVNNWSWFYKTGKHISPSSFKSLERIGTILNTNTHKWLKANDYQVSHTTVEPRQLVELLNRGRLDAVFMAEAVFLEAVARHQEKAQFKQHIGFAKPMGIYISHAYQDKYPDLLPSLNKLIDSTAQTSQHD